MFEKIHEAPKTGVIYALLKGKIIYEAYSDVTLDEIKSKLDELIELHIFDDNREYRIVNSNRGSIEVIIDDSYECDDTYIEKVYISENDPDKSEGFKSDDMVSVINYLKYDDMGMLKIVNFRFSTDLSLKESVGR